MRLSQGQLNCLETCPRKFQQLYLDQLGTLATLEQQERMTWGSRFHLLMQQRELGLPIADMSPDPDQLQQSVDAFVKAAPGLFQSHPDSVRQSEHRRTLYYESHLLTVVYDLMILEPQQAQILDWKTYPRPQRDRWLAQDWQTRLYPFVLAETSDYQPEQITMTYWFVRSGNLEQGEIQPQSIQFPYTSAKHEQTRHQLTRLLRQLDQWLEAYQAGNNFPQLPASEEYCPSCQFMKRCERDPSMAAIAPSLPDLAAIQEVSI